MPGPVPRADREPEAPPATGLAREARALVDFGRLLWRLPRLRREPALAGRPVIILPGFGSTDRTLWTLSGYLRSLGYRTFGWGLGRNSGNVPVLIPKVVARTAEVAARCSRPVSLVGWSLGGVLARETARERADLVARVITLGTPVVGGPKYTVTAEWYRRRGYDLDRIEAEVAERNRTPIQVPITAIYSRNDGVVAWQACIDRLSPDVEHVEVASGHLGLPVSPEVYRIVARRLAAA